MDSLHEKPPLRMPVKAHNLKNRTSDTFEKTAQLRILIKKPPFLEITHPKFKIHLFDPFMTVPKT